MLSDPAVTAVVLADVAELNDSPVVDLISKELVRDCIGMGEEGPFEGLVASMSCRLEDGMHLDTIGSGETGVRGRQGLKVS